MLNSCLVVKLRWQLRKAIAICFRSEKRAQILNEQIFVDCRNGKTKNNHRVQLINLKPISKLQNMQFMMASQPHSSTLLKVLADNVW